MRGLLANAIAKALVKMASILPQSDVGAIWKEAVDVRAMTPEPPMP